MDKKKPTGIVQCHISAEQARSMLIDWEYKVRNCIFKMHGGQYLSEIYVFKSSAQMGWARDNMDKLDRCGGAKAYVITPRLFVGKKFIDEIRLRIYTARCNRRKTA